MISAPYPYLCRTIWGDVEHFAVDDGRVSGGWKGDGDRFVQTYWSRWPDAMAYTQGDFAVKYADGGFSLHGRSDDVINVSGHRMGTEEIEGAILRDKQINPDSPVGNVIVVGAPHREKGLTPIAFVKAAAGKRFAVEDRRRLADLVRQEKGAVAVPSDFIRSVAVPGDAEREVHAADGAGAGRRGAGGRCHDAAQSRGDPRAGSGRSTPGKRANG